MSIVLHDLAGADPDLRFSPYCWRTRFALAHKALPVETVPWRFTDRDAIAFSGQGKVPVIQHEGRVVSDSWAIAEYLEEQVPTPTLFGGAGGRAHALFINSWADGVLVGGIARLIVRDILDVIHPKDRDYFRSSREVSFWRAAWRRCRPGATSGWRRSANCFCRCVWCCGASRGWAERRRVMRIISSQER